MKLLLFIIIITIYICCGSMLIESNECVGVSRFLNKIAPDLRLISVKILDNSEFIDNVISEIFLLQIPVFVQKQSNNSKLLPEDSPPSLNLIIASNFTQQMELPALSGEINCLMFINVSFVYLEEFLHSLWNKRRNLNNLVHFPCAEPEFVYFYNPFKGHMKKTKWKELQMFNRKSHLDMNKFEIRISMFPRLPTAILDSTNNRNNHPVYKNVNRSGFTGLDGIVLAELSNYFNFAITLVKSAGFGSPNSNGTYSGSWKDILEKRADIAGNSRFIQPFDPHLFTFTSSIDCDSICIVVPKSEKIPDYAILIHIFTKTVWLTIAFICFISIAFWMCERQLNVVMFLHILPLFFAGPISDRVYPRSRAFLVCCLLYMIILNGVFNGALMMSFSKITYYPEINTMEEFDQSGLPILTNLPIFTTDNTSIFRRLRRKVIVAQCTLAEVAFRRDVAVLERKRDARVPKLKFIGHNGVALLHIVDECPVLKHLAYLASADFPFLKQFDFLLGLFASSGLLDKWYTDVVETLIVDQRFQNRTAFNRNFTLRHAHIPFFIWLTGLLLSTLTFVIEMIDNQLHVY